MTEAKRCPCGLRTIPDECTCGHIVYSHDLNREDERTRCSVSSGPTCERCPCKRYEEVATVAACSHLSREQGPP